MAIKVCHLPTLLVVWQITCNMWRRTNPMHVVCSTTGTKSLSKHHNSLFKISNTKILEAQTQSLSFGDLPFFIKYSLRTSSARIGRPDGCRDSQRRFLFCDGSMFCFYMFAGLFWSWPLEVRGMQLGLLRKRAWGSSKSWLILVVLLLIYQPHFDITFIGRKVS